VVSPQSQPLIDREQLESSAAQLAERYAGDQVIPRPEYWGGYLLKPNRVEFWQGRPNRLHDRFLYSRNEAEKPTESWTISRLAP
jgi:pyridoxamine 5'-phosphate oxidase